ncbi:hypothetical protein PR048_011362 [Dryococelus australis]|uniref:HTH CENPB-type domain-containing protein n=1 Tax=Dryococelus australis TaxID=614101 RepID=A0ABQ9HLD0_9NEOP|nr:hypothetical protein PR048_011362 [Dryococelus australis]
MISEPMLIETGKEFYDEKMRLTMPYIFSEGWLTRFKDRHGIRKLDVSEQVGNADETGLMCKCLPNTTLAGGNENSTPGFNHNKELIIVLVCANAAGTH